MEEDHENPTSEEPPKTADRIEFKKPVLIGRIGKLPKKVKTEPEKATEKISDEKRDTEEKVAEKSNVKSNLPPAVLLKELSTPIPYKEPKWSGLCPDGSDYALEVLKSGLIVEKVELNGKPYHVFGRLANCDVVMAHPTISRHHAVLQYKAFAEEGEPACGWYMFDLGSTHGTFLNKDKLKPNHYTRVRVGHQIKFGTSTRTYIVLGPDYDCEGESDLTVTEIKKKAQELKVERDRMIKESIEQRERDRLEEERRREEQGIDWGMGEDAEEEPDLADNPFASTANEELYLEDPKKTLRGYFEREGHDLTYNCEERGTGQFLCRVELPIDDARGRPLVAEVTHRGKKKEAVIACALEACRILDRAGLLRQATHESRRRKERDWSADDYYDSDDDTFLDRTGAVERKRNIRMRKHGANEPEAEKPLTYDDLLKQITEIERKILNEEKTLDSLRATNRPKEEGASEIDALDEYMTSLGRQGQSMATKAEISKTKMSIQKLKAELSKTQRLAEIARPAHLPPLVKQDSKMAVRSHNSIVFGKRIKLKEDLERRKKIKTAPKQEEEEFVEENDSDEEILQESKEENINTSISIEIDKKSLNTSKDSSSDDERDRDINIRKEGKEQKTPKDTSSEMERDKDSVNVKEGKEQKRIFGPMRPPDNYVIPESYFEQINDRDLPEIEENE